jgi:hypothetical protein
MTKKQTTLLVLSIVVALTTAGCGEKSTKKTGEDAKPESVQAADVVPRDEHQLPTISMADLSKPTSAYREMKNSADTIYAYYAIFPTDVNYGRIAEAISKKYRGEQDGFKKQDIVETLKADMDAGLKKARDNKYYFLNFPAGRMNVEAYNFEKKAFFNPGLGINQDPYRSYSVPTFALPDSDGGGRNGAELRFSNVKQFSNVKIEDQQVARKMESLRNSGKLSMNVYFYANDIRVDIPSLIAQITKVEYVDPAGDVVFTQVK